MWVINIRHWLDESLTGPGLPQLRFKVKKLTELITYTTAKEAGVSCAVQTLCWRKPKRKPFPGELEISLNPNTEQIHWLCLECGDESVLTGWKGLIWDMKGSESGLFH